MAREYQATFCWPSPLISTSPASNIVELTGSRPALEQSLVGPRVEEKAYRLDLPFVHSVRFGARCDADIWLVTESKMAQTHHVDTLDHRAEVAHGAHERRGILVDLLGLLIAALVFAT